MNQEERYNSIIFLRRLSHPDHFYTPERNAEVREILEKVFTLEDTHRTTFYTRVNREEGRRVSWDLFRPRYPEIKGILAEVYSEEKDPTSATLDILTTARPNIGWEKIIGSGNLVTLAEMARKILIGLSPRDNFLQELDVPNFINSIILSEDDPFANAWDEMVKDAVNSSDSQSEDRGLGMQLLYDVMAVRHMVESVDRLRQGEIDAIPSFQMHLLLKWESAGLLCGDPGKSQEENDKDAFKNLIVSLARELNDLREYIAETKPSNSLDEC